MAMRMRTTGPIAVLLLVGSAAIAQDSVRDLRFETRDLIFTVQDVGEGEQRLAVTETATEILIELSGDVLFEFDRANIVPEAETVLADVAEVLRRHADAAVLIAGYTDALGSERYNLELSQRRADAVKQWLVTIDGVPGRTVQARGFGKANPVAPNTHPDGSDNPEGRQLNRRVEITVRK